jgi:hypothetical protein
MRLILGAIAESISVGLNSSFVRGCQLQTDWKNEPVVADFLLTQRVSRGTDSYSTGDKGRKGATMLHY